MKEVDNIENKECSEHKPEEVHGGNVPDTAVEEPVVAIAEANDMDAGSVGLDFASAGKSEYRDESVQDVSSESQGDSHLLTTADLVEESAARVKSFIYMPSAGSTDEPVEPVVEVDYKGVDYHGFGMYTSPFSCYIL